MKKRLSLLLATLMIFTMLPMSSFAAAVSDSFVPQNVYVDDKGTVKGSFILPIGADIKAGQIVIEVENAKIDGALGANAVTTIKANASTAAANINKVNDNMVTADLPVVAAAENLGDVQLGVELPLEFTKEGDVFIKVRDSLNLGVGNVTAKVAIATVKDASNLAVTVKDAEKTISFDGGEVSQFEIKNIPTGTTTIVIEADDGFVWSGTTVAGVGLSTGKTVAGAEAGKKLTLTFNQPLAAADKKASVIVTPKFGNLGRKASEGPIMVDLDARDAAKSLSTNRAVIGKLVDYNVTMTVVEVGKKEIPSVWGGEEAKVRVTLKGPKGSLSSRDIDFKVDGANVFYGKDDGSDLNSPTVFKAVKPNDFTISGDPAVKKNPAANTVFKNREFSLVQGATKFDTVEEVSFEIVIRTAGSKDGMATITAAQRGWEAKADLAKVTPKFKAEADVTPVKKGEARDTSKVVITEAKAGLLEKGQYLTLSFDTRRDYTAFTSKSVKVEATNGMKLDTASSEVKTIKSSSEIVTIAIPIVKSSYNEPAVITITGLNVAVDGSATDDMIKLDAGLIARNKAVESDNVVGVSSPDYIKVVKEYALESILTVFTIGQTQYTVNGEAKTAASAPYIKNGKTMLPIRALSESLGLTVQWNGQTKTATFTDSTKVAAVTIGAEKMFVNGTPIPLAAKAELVNGTTFVELRSLATAFGVQIDWDAAAKTATVSK